MTHTHIIRILTATALCLTVAQIASPGVIYTEVGQRIRRAIANNDRSELFFLEATGLNDDPRSPDPDFAAHAYIKIANLDESIAFMRRFYFNPDYPHWRHSLYWFFLDKSFVAERDAENETREKLYALLLEIVQTSDNSEDVHWTDAFLLERLPEYAASKQRATLQRYANTGNEWVTNTFNPIKEHFDKIPPKERTDLRDRFPELPPPDEPAVTPLPPQDDPSAEPPAKPFLLWLVATIIAVALAVGAVTLRAVRE